MLLQYLLIATSNPKDKQKMTDLIILLLTGKKIENLKKISIL